MVLPSENRGSREQNVLQKNCHHTCRARVTSPTSVSVAARWAHSTWRLWVVHICKVLFSARAEMSKYFKKQALWQICHVLGPRRHLLKAELNWGIFFFKDQHSRRCCNGAGQKNSRCVRLLALQMGVPKPKQIDSKPGDARGMWPMKLELGPEFLPLLAASAFTVIY